MIGNSPRQQQKKMELQQAGLNVLEINNQWVGEEVDRQIAKSRALLNLDHSDEFKIFEEIQCHRWMAAKMPVLTEDSLYFDKEMFKPYCLSVKYANIVQVAVTCKNITWEKIQQQVLLTAPALARIFTFWFGPDPAPKRQDCLRTIEKTTELSHIHITHTNWGTTYCQTNQYIQHSNI